MGDESRELRRLWELADRDEIEIRWMRKRCAEYQNRIDRLNREVEALKNSNGTREGSPDIIYPKFVSNRFSEWFIYPHEDGTADISTADETLVKNIDRGTALKMIGKHNDVIHKLVMTISDFGEVNRKACESSWYRKEP